MTEQRPSDMPDPNKSTPSSTETSPASPEAGKAKTPEAAAASSGPQQADSKPVEDAAKPEPKDTPDPVPAEVVPTSQTGAETPAASSAKTSFDSPPPVTNPPGTLPAKPAPDGGKTTTPPKARTGRIPKPMPRGRDGTTLSASPAPDDPMSTETISLKRPDFSPRVSTAKSAQEPETRPLKIFCWKCAQKLDLSDMEPFSQLACPSCKADIIVPKWFDNYLLEERSGEGGMAIVYRGLDLALDREVAIKVLSPDLAKEEQKSNLFLHEARTAATLNHYAVLPIYTCGEFEDQPYIVMQWMAGGSLDVKLADAKDPMPIMDTVKWMRDIAEGLDNARRHGIIHHDVKPANVMLDADGNVKIGDFGISQAMHDARSEKLNELTKTWASPHYVSPEKVATGKETYLGDIYSLGATFHHLLTGREPFANEYNLERLIRIRLDQDPPSPRSLRPDIPEEVSALVSAMMARTPEARPSYRDVINDLNAILKGSGAKAGARKPRAAKSHDLPPVATRVKINNNEFGQNLARTNAPAPGGGMGLLVILILAVAILGGAIYLFTNSSKGNGNSAETVNDLLPAVTQAFAVGDSRQAQSLAEKTLDDPLASVAARRQAAVQAALATYLNREDGAANQCRLIAGRLAANGADHEPTAIVISFLAGRGSSPDALRMQLANHPDLLAGLEMAALLRVLYEKAPRDQIQTAYSAYYQTAMRLPGGHWAGVWRSRVGRWIDWIVTGQGTPEGLEPLILSFKPPEVGALPVSAVTPGTEPGTQINPPSNGTTHPDMSLLTAEWLAKQRTFAGARPRPKDYEFNQTQFRAYVTQIPADRQEGERKRHQTVSSLKSYLCKMMMRFAYDGGSIQLSNGQRLSGAVMANEKYLSVRTAGGRQRVQWGEIPVEQMAAFLEYYAKVRIDATAGTVSDQERSRESARDYLRVALLYDWYGNYPEAVRLAKKAIDADRRTTAEVRGQLME